MINYDLSHGAGVQPPTGYSYHHPKKHLKYAPSTPKFQVSRIQTGTFWVVHQETKLLYLLETIIYIYKYLHEATPSHFTPSSSPPKAFSPSNPPNRYRYPTTLPPMIMLQLKKMCVPPIGALPFNCPSI